MGFRVWGPGLWVCEVVRHSASVISVDVTPPALLIIHLPQGLIRS